jgi:hypothetical protein
VPWPGPADRSEVSPGAAGDGSMERIGGRPRPGCIAIPALGVLIALIGMPVARLLGGSLAAWAGGLGGAALVVLGGLQVVHRYRYRPVAFDEVTGRAVLGSTEMALDEVRHAERRVSAGGTAAYLEYRFTGRDGSWGRVLVLGQPMRGLDLSGLRRLQRFVDLAGIEGAASPDGLNDDQRVAVDALDPTGGVSVVGKDLLRRELTAIIAAMEGGGGGVDAAADQPRSAAVHGSAGGEVEPSGAVAPTGPGDPRLVAAWEADDRDAEAWFAAQPGGPARLRRLLGWLTALGVVAFCLVVGWAALQEQSRSSGRLDADTNDAVGALAVAAMLGTGVSYLAYTIAHWWHVRRLQAAARAWLARRGPAQAERGAPAVVVGIFLARPPAHHLQVASGIGSCAVGSVAALTGLVAWSTGDLGAAVALLVTAVGLVLLGLGTVLLVRARRTRKVQLLEAVRLGGPRLTVGAA